MLCSFRTNNRNSAVGGGVSRACLARIARYTKRREEGAMRASRRAFLVGGAASVAGLAVDRGAIAAVGPQLSRVVRVEDPRATRSTTRIDPEVVARMVEEALRVHGGTATAAAALAAHFKPAEKVAIKVNAFGHPCSMVNPVTALTLARLLVEAGLRKPNIRIYDQYESRMRGAGYRLGKPADGIWVTGPDGADPALQEYRDGNRRVSFHWAQALVWADAVLNVCVPKDHDLTGVTGALKNVAFGSVRPTAARQKQPNGYTTVPAFHRNNADPAIAWLYAQPMIRDKVRLVVCDATRVLYQGGPKDNERHRARNNQILVSTDPVAMDVMILEIVNRHRKANRLKPIESDPRRPPRHIATAARLGLGVGERSRVTVVDRKLG
jgi:hypothetical protein